MWGSEAVPGNPGTGNSIAVHSLYVSTPYEKFFLKVTYRGTFIGMRFAKHHELSFKHMGTFGPIWQIHEGGNREVSTYFIPANCDAFERWQPGDGEVAVESSEKGLLVREVVSERVLNKATQFAQSEEKLPPTQAIPLKKVSRTKSVLRVFIKTLLLTGVVAGAAWFFGVIPSVGTEDPTCLTGVEEKLEQFFTLRAQMLMAQDLEALAELESGQVLIQDVTVVSQLQEKGVELQKIQFSAKVKSILHCPTKDYTLENAVVQAEVVQKQMVTCLGEECSEQESDTTRVLELEFDSRGKLHAVNE